MGPAAARWGSGSRPGRDTSPLWKTRAAGGHPSALWSFLPLPPQPTRPHNYSSTPSGLSREGVLGAAAQACRSLEAGSRVHPSMWHLAHADAGLRSSRLRTRRDPLANAQTTGPGHLAPRQQARPPDAHCPPRLQLVTAHGQRAGRPASRGPRRGASRQPEAAPGRLTVRRGGAPARAGEGSRGLRGFQSPVGPTGDSRGHHASCWPCRDLLFRSVSSPGIRKDFSESPSLVNAHTGIQCTPDQSGMRTQCLTGRCPDGTGRRPQPPCSVCRAPCPLSSMASSPCMPATHKAVSDLLGR